MICNICGEKVVNGINVSNRRWEKLYHHCENCDFIFIDEKYILSSSEELDRYKTHNNNVGDPVYEAYFEKFISYAFDGVENVEKILDYGSGPEPVLANVLQKKGYMVDIYDKYFADENIYQNKKYDLIVSTEVFEHIWDPMPVLEDLAKTIDKEGYLVLMTNFHTSRKNEFSNWWYIQDPTHISFYSPKTFAYIAERLGFNIVKHNEKNIIVFRKKEMI